MIIEEANWNANVSLIKGIMFSNNMQTSHVEWPTGRNYVLSEEISILIHQCEKGLSLLEYIMMLATESYFCAEKWS